MKASLNIDTKKLEQSLKKLELHGHIKISNKMPSHTGDCYELTESVLALWGGVNKTIWEEFELSWGKVLFGTIAFFGVVIAYVASLFTEEIKIWLMEFFK